MVKGNKKLEEENKKLLTSLAKKEQQNLKLKEKIKKLEEEVKKERKLRYDALYDLKQLRDPKKKKTTGLSDEDIKAINKAINKINKGKK